MALPRTKFDWSVLDRISLQSFVWLISDQIVDKRLTISQFQSIVSKHLKTFLPIKVSRLQNNQVDSGYVYVAGLYDGDLDWRKQRCISIILEYNPKDRIFKLTSGKFKRFCLVVADTLLHEIIHMRQYRRRNFKSLPDYASTAEKTKQRKEQIYLGHSDEIDAYSFNIACELLDKFRGNPKKVVKYLSEDQQYKKSKFNSWRTYLKAFDYDQNHKIIRKVKKRVIHYLPYAEIGKPYKGKDWINR